MPVKRVQRKGLPNDLHHAGGRCSMRPEGISRQENPMRDHVVFLLNGQRQQVSGAAAFLSLTDYLRHYRFLSGTKVVCAEGDCGACTVLVGRPDGEGLRHETVDACILFLYQLDGASVLTVEGLADNGVFSPVQQAMVAHHGSQCGYCTPGFVMTLTGLLAQPTPLDEPGLRLGLTGNLCRCTGYLPILEAARSLAPQPLPAPPRSLLDELRRCAAEPVRIQAEQRRCFAPDSLEAALAFKAEHPGSVIVAGNTELGVLHNKRALAPAELLSLARVPGLAEITCVNGKAVIGANVTWTQLEPFVRTKVPEFHAIVIRFGSPQIRNVATLIGNVANGSPIADSLPFLFVCGAELELASQRGRRRVAIDRFYQGYKVKDQQPDEIITHVHLPLPEKDDLLRLYKVSRRNDLDIATFGAGIRVRCANRRIEEAHIAYAGVAPMVVRLARTEAFLRGQPFARETFDEAGRLARAEVQPITDVRGSRDYRLLLAENILRKFYFESVEAGPRQDGQAAGHSTL